MAIEITGLPGNNINESADSRKSAPQNATNVTTNTNANPASEAIASTDVITITTQAVKLKALEDSVSTQSVVDDQRVAELKSAIDSGDYQVDPLRVAEKFLQFESSLVA